MRVNNHKLPERVLRVIEGLNPQRERPEKHVVHVTDLIRPAYAWNLYREKWDEIQEDYSDWLISVQGDALHASYKKYLELQGWLCEHSFHAEFDGIWLTGTLDAYDPVTKTLVDLKCTSVWSPSYKIDDYTKQTNCYAWFLNHDFGYDVEKIQIDVWYRNWNLRQSGYSHDYPKIPYETLDIPVWSLAQTEEFIRSQIEYLHMCKDKCSRKDKWQKYQVMKNKNKTSSKNCETRQEAEAWIKKYQQENPQKKDKFKIVDGEPTHCLHYCNARSCCDYARSLKEKK